MIYLDYAANTPVDGEVLDVFVEATKKFIANPNSSHPLGVLAKEEIDKVSIKVAKYAISNSVPIVGGLIKDGLDIVAAGSVIVKNALGVAGLIGVFYYVLSPVLHMIVFSALLKLAAAITDTFAGDTVADFLTTVSKSVNYFVASVLTVGLMAFLTVLLMVFSANTVI